MAERKWELAVKQRVFGPMCIGTVFIILASGTHSWSLASYFRITMYTILCNLLNRITTTCYTIYRKVVDLTRKANQKLELHVVHVRLNIKYLWWFVWESRTSKAVAKVMPLVKLESRYLLGYKLQ